MPMQEKKLNMNKLSARQLQDNCKYIYKSLSRTWSLLWNWTMNESVVLRLKSVPGHIILIHSFQLKKFFKNLFKVITICFKVKSSQQAFKDSNLFELFLLFSLNKNSRAKVTQDVRFGNWHFDDARCFLFVFESAECWGKKRNIKIDATEAKLRRIYAGSLLCVEQHRYRLIGPNGSTSLSLSWPKKRSTDRITEWSVHLVFFRLWEADRRHC